MELKRCPLCKSEAELHKIDIAYGIYEELVRCTKCSCYAIAEDWNRRADGWIAVEDGLPEMRTDVWVHYRDGGTEIGCCRPFHGRPRWFVGFTIFPEGTVTHWMSLPEPPEVKGE